MSVEESERLIRGYESHEEVMFFLKTIGLLLLLLLCFAAIVLGIIDLFV